METPHHQPFEGFCEIELIPSSHFVESEKEPTSFTIWFFQRNTEDSTLDNFLLGLKPNNFGWDEITQQLFFKSKDNNTYIVNFTKI